MLNLLGRLHARPPSDLEHIAAFWQVPLVDGPRHRQIGQLYRTMTDPRAVRDTWERLNAGERDVVRVLSLGDQVALTIADLADRLQHDESAVRRTAARLYRGGVIARQGDDDPLPEGMAPVLFAPRELALLFRRVLDEIDADDVSTTPLRALLALLDDAELEGAARAWGIRVIPGLRERDDLTDQLLRQVADPDRVAVVVEARRHDAKSIWRYVRGQLEGFSIDLADAARAAGLHHDDPRTRQRLREALAELEESLLVWHTYAKGERKLFVPVEIRTPRVPSNTLPPLTPVVAATVPELPWRPPDALAWDLLTTVRELSMPGAPEIDDLADLPRSWLRHLTPRLWRRGEDRPPAGYVSFLLELAKAEGLIVQREDHGDAVFAVAPAARAWRDLGFPQQTELLRQRWLGHPDWIEGSGRGDLAVWGADWRGFRRRLLAHLSAVPTADGEAERPWYPVESVATWVAARDPDLLGPTFTAATARRVDHPGEGESERRRAALAEAVSVALETALQWFGIVNISVVAGQPLLMQMASEREATSMGEGDGQSGRPLSVGDDGSIELYQPTPLRVWSIGVFAEPERLDRVCRYRLTAATLGRALAAGFDQQQVATFLTRQSGASLPDAVTNQLGAWTRQYRRIVLRHAVVIEPDDPATLPALRKHAASMGLTIRDLDHRRLLVEAAPAVIEQLRARIAGAGYAPLWTDSA
ncbi:MAG TPA: helicase-associated domain-containing protein [Thermomicrobiales bacterium]|nr:helicase-associated domain-containing protein [Thermomicrobiales bacterium]